MTAFIGYVLIAGAAAIFGFILMRRAVSDVQRLRSRIATSTHQALNELFWFIPLAQFARLMVLPCLGMCLLWWWLLPTPMLAIVAPLSFGLPLFGLKWLRARRQRLLLQQLPDMLTLLSAGLKSGVTLVASFNMLSREVSSPMREELLVVLRAVRLGQTITEALQAWQVRQPSSDLHQVVLAITLAQQSGGQQGHILQRLATTMRRKQQLQLKVLALTAQGRMQGKVMVALPLLLLAALYTIERPVILALAYHPLGWGACTLLFGLLGTGYWLVRQQVKLPVAL
ncbi:MAG: hypothetical protein C0463_01425 [Idiomarina sp.]|nr:hypothetical protein [Idiomarina sp.]